MLCIITLFHDIIIAHLVSGVKLFLKIFLNFFDFFRCDFSRHLVALKVTRKNKKQKGIRGGCVQLWSKITKKEALQTGRGSAAKQTIQQKTPSLDIYGRGSGVGKKRA